MAKRRKYKRDFRWPVGLTLTAIGAAVVLVTRWINGDSWSEFGVNAAYSVGRAFLTFAVLYLLSMKFGAWEWAAKITT